METDQNYGWSSVVDENDRLLESRHIFKEHVFPDAAALQDVNLSFECSVSETTCATRLMVKTPLMRRSESNYSSEQTFGTSREKRSTILFRIMEYDFLPKPKDIPVKVVPIKQSLVSGRLNSDFS